jgi:thioredoxin-dependent peroxiredoxin
MKKYLLVSLIFIVTVSRAQTDAPGYLRIGDAAPDFTAETTQGIVNFYQWLGKSWGILFSHPADFTPVCTTELGAVAGLKPEFEKRDVKVIALSVDPIESHRKWIGDINQTQHVEVNFPLIADPGFKVANLYGMVHPNASQKATVRSVFIIGPDKKVKLMLTYPASTGRNFDEILRVVESLQLTANYSVATPANWKYGEDVIISPSIKNEEIPAKFPKGHKEIKPYLRTTPQPDLK